MNKALRPPADAAATLALARALIRLDTANPPGNEAIAADLIEDRLAAQGMQVLRKALAPGRDSLIVRAGDPTAPAICLCGHLDTVPFAQQVWTQEPLGAGIEGDRLFGRGSTDMKAGVAAMITAFERVHAHNPQTPVLLALCASEETGCQGAADIAGDLGPVGALVIAEPTGGKLAIGHKGVLWLRITVRGKAAHGSRPDLGVSAIAGMTEVLGLLSRIDFGVAPDALLGSPTMNVGTIAGGEATNIVPARCECTLDIRLVPGLSAEQATETVRSTLGDRAQVEPILALDAVRSEADDPWIQSVLAAVNTTEGAENGPVGVTYFTDASVLAPALGSPPVAIVGPGEVELAHQADESCSIAAIWRSSLIYERLLRDWNPKTPRKDQANG